jgi:hypothetical protein
MTARRRRQLQLAVRIYCVCCDGFGEIEIQAGTAGAAKYEVFRRARDAGFFRGPHAFRDFLHCGWTARERRTKARV